MKANDEPPLRVRRTLAVRRPPADVHAFWRDAQQLSRLLDRRIRVESTTSTKSHWAVHAPGHIFEWDIAITADELRRKIGRPSCSKT